MLICYIHFVYTLSVYLNFRATVQLLRRVCIDIHNNMYISSELNEKKLSVYKK